MSQTELHDFESPEHTVARLKRRVERVLAREGPPEVSP